MHDDLIGFEFNTEYGRVRVAGPVSWSKDYVRCEYLDDTGTVTVRRASEIRRVRELMRRHGD